MGNPPFRRARRVLRFAGGTGNRRAVWRWPRAVRNRVATAALAQRRTQVRVRATVLGVERDGLPEGGDGTRQVRLAREGHLVAAGAVGQSVLEEHLREWCVRSGCAEGHVSAGELSVALYRRGHLSKVERETAAALSAAGEHCVRNEQPPLAAQDVQKMLDGVREFLLAHPLP